MSFKTLKISILVPMLLILLSACSIESKPLNSNHDAWQVCFTPGQECTALIVNTINTAQLSIYVQAYSFTSAEIANALVAAKNRGVQTLVILDKSQLKERYSQMNNLHNAHISLWIDNKVAIAHNKVMVIDRKTVITGSFNFTNAAQKRNAENVLILQSQALAAEYLKNWEQRQQESVLQESN